MDRIRNASLFILFLFLPLISLAYEPTPSAKPIYITANAGLFQGTFNIKYVDQLDVIPQNIAETIQQRGYTGGIGLGYSKILYQLYLIGAELSGGGMSQNATYQSGAATSAFNDKFAVQDYIDLVVVPGIFLTPSVASYLKLGATWGQFSDSLNTPAGYNPTFITNNSTQNGYGFTASIGLKKWLTPVWSVFAEYNYRDYGTVNFPSFQNFSTTYSHLARIVGQSVLLGLTYQVA